MKTLATAALSCVAGLAAAGRPAAAVQHASSHPLKVEVREVWSTYGDPGFGHPQGAFQWPDGTVWIGDDQASEAWELSADGTESKRVLREGEGPGELAGVFRIVPYRDGGVVVQDNRGFLFFGADKRFVRQMKWGGPIWSDDVMAAPNGDLIVIGGFAYEDHKLARYAVHRIDRRRGWPVKSWHPAAAGRPFARRRAALSPSLETEGSWCPTRRRSGSPAMPT